ncbi:MAG: DNA replication/repair protein RecF, partial [Bdellovibrionota bacterium]
QKFQRTLEQRNTLLKTEPPAPRELLHGFTEPLATYSAALTLKRLQSHPRLAPRLDDIVHQIAPKQAPLKLVYLSNWVPRIDSLSIENENLGSVHFSGQEHLPSVELLEQAFWKKWSILESAERRSGHSLVGPHRDDWTFFLGNQILKGHGSQGEIRSALLGLKLSEIELFRSATGHRPLFLLDDFSSELDQERRSFLLRFLSNTDLQVFVTTTEGSAFSEIGKRFWVLNGRLHDHAAVPG